MSRNKGTPLPAEDRRRLRKFVEARTFVEAIALIGCSRQTLYAALAGAPVYRITATIIRVALDREAPAVGAA